MRLRRKITVAFFLVSTLVSVLLAVFLYRFVEGQLTAELRARLRDITHLGTHAVDVAAYQRLRAQVTGDLDAATVTAIERSPDYATVSRQLNAIRTTEPELIRYAYLLIPSGEPGVARFVVDADVLAGLDATAAGGTAGGEALSHFAQRYEVGRIPKLAQALIDCRPVVEEDFVYDPGFDVHSVSAYYPLLDPGADPADPADDTCIGILGVDITDKNMRAALDAAGALAIRISLAVIALALIVSIVMSTLLTRSILALSETVTRFADKDFAARTRIVSRDEIGQLSRNFNTMAATIQAHSDNLEHLVLERTSELYAEKQTSERLLLNVLPGPIAERLKHGDGIIVDRFDDVSVLFADIVGFTALSARTSPEDLVGMLDELFSVFDRLAEVHGLEKIKTIGDCYMAVAGIPQPTADHAEAIARMALDMIEALRDYSRRHATELTIRVGIHTGSVVAGVIGRKKFIYDLWGDTVNLASRMESHGIPGRVHVTEATYQRLAAGFDLEHRGSIDIKGRGPMATYLLIGAKPAADAGPA